MTHVSSFSYLWKSQTHLEDQAQLAGVLDFTALKRAVAATVPTAWQWRRLVHILKTRAELRYERFELIQEEWNAHSRWCGEDPTGGGKR